MRRWAVLVLALSMAEMAGCARIRVHRSSNDSVLPEKKMVLYRFSAFGLVSLDSPVTLKDECKDRWQTLSTEVRGLNGVWTALSLNLYSPWTIEVGCAAPKQVRDAEDW